MSDRSCTTSLARTRLALPTFAAALLLATAAYAVEPAADETDRAIAFVQRSSEAADLYNEHKFSEALAVFQELTKSYADLDVDGFAAMGLADALYGLGRVAEARVQYEALAAARPELARSVLARLREIALAGEPDDELLNQLRQEAASNIQDTFLVHRQLGRALQKRAAALIEEAIRSFRTAAESDSDARQTTGRMVAIQAETLAEFREDLLTLIDRIEKACSGFTTIGEMIEWEGDDAEANMTGYRAEWTSPTATQPSVRIEMTRSDGGHSVAATADGRPIGLSPTQALLIRRHQERINTILKEAMQAEAAGQAKP